MLILGETAHIQILESRCLDWKTFLRSHQRNVICHCFWFWVFHTCIMLTKRQMTVSTGCCVCPNGACWCGRSAGGSPSPGCWSQWRCRGCAGCSSSTAAAMTLGHEGGGTGHGIQPSGLEILILGCWAGQWTRSWVGRCGTLPGSPADSPLLELSTNLR